MSFPLKGNVRVKDAVQSVISSNRLPHAVIIEGEAGTGKRTLAKYLAKVAVCDSSAPPCCSCRSCHLADIGTHPDIETVAPEDKKKNISVEQIRSLRTTAHHSAHTSKRRAFIIEQANTMNASSQNALLKVLEDPPSDVLFILVVNSSSDLLETVVSRCLVLSLSAPSLEEAIEHLVEISKINRERAHELCISCGNNIGRALELISGKTDSAGRLAAHEYFEKIKQADILSALLCTVTLEKKRPEVATFVNELCEILFTKIKSAGNMNETAREYMRMYELVKEMSPLLDTNINLSLFFSALTSKIIAAKENN